MQTLTIINSLVPTKKKERFEIILEPLQAMLQLAFLAFCPIGTKLNITNNILYIQIPNWQQSIVRTYYKDSKDDLFYLFNVIGRYKSFYSRIKEVDDEEKKLYQLILDLAKRGIDNLLLTYQHADKISLLHTLRMYKTMMEEAYEKPIPQRDTNIDSVFINIRDLYSEHEIKIIYYTLLILEKNPLNFITYIDGINHTLTPLNDNIKKWINDNIVF
jgi:hypothetical protein